jgi:anaerobic selenocysteine-containing dehydrogenase
MRAAGLLPALTGNIGKPGAGFYYLNVTPILAGVDLDWLAGAPIAREGGKTVSHMHLADRLGASDEFRVFFSWNTNPLASAPEQTRLRAALERDDLFTVVSDVFMTDTARYADIVLPAASFLEYDDITFSYFHLHMGAQSRVGNPMGESLPNAEIFRRLARAMDLHEPALFESDESLIDTMMQQMGAKFDFAELKQRGHYSISEQPASWWAEQEFETPSGKIEIASAAAEAMGLPRTPQPWADQEVTDGRLRLISPASKWRLNDSYANDKNIGERSGPAALHLNPSDAAHFGVQEGVAVMIANDSGELALTARLDEDVLPGTAISYKGRWPSLQSDNSNVNFVHSANIADMGESTAVHSTLVTVRPV